MDESRKANVSHKDLPRGKAHGEGDAKDRPRSDAIAD